MKFVDIFKRLRNRKSDSKAQALYVQLISSVYQGVYRLWNVNEGMSIAEEVICQYWKPRFLLDHNAKCAYEFMTSDETLTTITDNDIDWESLNGLPEACISRAHRLDAHFPTKIHQFEGGVAEVSWELNPDGRYYMDEDGYGMTDDEEITIYGIINRKGQVLVKFRYIAKDWELLKSMKQEALKRETNN